MATATDMAMRVSKPEFLVAAIPVVALLFFASSGVHAQVTITPIASISETLTDNVLLSHADQQSEQITEVSAGVRINVNGPRLKTYFDYSLVELVYAQNTSPNHSQRQNGLNTFGALEVFENWGFVDFSGAISQQAISAFGTQSIDNTSVNANRTEVSNYRVSPYFRGRFGDLASYEARYSRAVTSSDSVAVSGVNTVDGSVKLSGASAFSNLGWSTDIGQQVVNYSAGRTTESNHFSVGLTYTTSPRFNVFVRSGRETNNYTSPDAESAGTSGFGLNWSPSEVSKLSASRDLRSFGETFSLSYMLRTGRTVWQFTDSKDVSSAPSQTGIASIGSVYDLLYKQFESQEPNPVARAQLVNGISPTATATSGFLTSAVSLQRRQDLSFALLGVRDTVTVIATRSVNSRLDTQSIGVDDLATSSLVRQHGVSVNYSHRLTPDFSLGVLVSQQITSGSSSEQDTSLRSVNVNLTGKVGKQSSATVGVRHVVSGAGSAPYTETAVTGNLNVQF